MSLQQTFTVELVEKELIDVELIEKELVSVNLNVIDILKDRGWVVEAIRDNIIFPVVPTKMTSRKFKTPSEYSSGTLMVFLNGQKMINSEIQKDSDNEFSFPIDIISSDKIEVMYLKK